MKTDLPQTDVDSFTRYEWQVSSAIRPLWQWRDEVPYRIHLHRVVYFGHLCLAEPVRGKRNGPPYAVLTMPKDTFVRYSTQEEISLEFSREDAAKAVERYDRELYKDQTQPSLFEETTR